MRSTLVVTTVSTAPFDLLTIDEMRMAAGLEPTDDSQDTKLRFLARGVAASIMSECNIAVGAGGDPTLLRETLTETFYWPSGIDLVLARRHNVTITSVTETRLNTDDVVVLAADYILDPESGILTRLWTGSPYSWYGETAVIVYSAGFETVPPDLKQAAMDFMRATWAEASRDPWVKSSSIDIPGVESKRVDYWVGSVPGQSGESVVPDIVSGQLKRFRNPPNI